MGLGNKVYYVLRKKNKAVWTSTGMRLPDADKSSSIRELQLTNKLMPDMMSISIILYHH
jgi:hypothetical protein